MSTHGKAAAESMLRVLLQHNLTPEGILQKSIHDAAQLAKRRPPHDNGISFSELSLGTPEIISLLQALPAESDPVKIAEMCFSIGWNAHFLTHQALFDKERAALFKTAKTRNGLKSLDKDGSPKPTTSSEVLAARGTDDVLALWRGYFADGGGLPEGPLRKRADIAARKKAREGTHVTDKALRQAIHRWKLKA